MKRVTETQGRNALKAANKDRQYSQGTTEKFAVLSSDIVDLFAKYVESKMEMPPNSGRGCRMTKQHVELHFGTFYRKIREFMDGEDNEQ